MAVVVGLAAVVFERIRIEKSIAGQRNAAEETVVKRALEDIHVFAFAGHEEHAVVPEKEGDGGAGFIITTVREFIVVAIGLAGRARAAAACQVELGFHHVVPDGGDGFEVTLVALERGDIGHAGIKIVRAHGVADGLALIDDRHVVLAVVAARRATAGIDEKLREIQPAGIAGFPVEFGEAHLDHLMAGWNDRFAIAEIAMNEFRAFQADVHE